jgi:ATP-dependent helicase HrpB
VIPLPIDGHVAGIVARLRADRAVVVVAAPGAGKTTRVPPALVDDGPVILLQPRRIAARSIARRIAAERGWTAGREVGWQVRHERRFTAGTRLLVATEGVLTARMQSDPLLSDFRTVVIDEFHERSIHADLGLALARQAMVARGDLRVVVMSATMDAAPVAAFLGGCAIVEAPGRTFPLDVAYRPGTPIEDAVADELPHARAAILCFLPGAPEIRRTHERLASDRRGRDVPLFALYGALDADAQDAALAPGTGPRVILATNIAETTLTVPDVTCVIDSGLHKVARYDADRGVDSLTTERISQDAADQRAGRAGRVQGGRAIRLWDARDRLRPHREPEIARVDLAPVALDVVGWGGDPATFEWFQPPPAGALDAALQLLRRLGLIEMRPAPGSPPASGPPPAPGLTPQADRLRRLPLHPRLGRMLIEGRGTASIALACALISERHALPPRHGATTCDLLAAVDEARALPEHVRRVASELRDAARQALDGRQADRIDDRTFRRAVLAGYPDRVARRRDPKSDRFLLASGTGARLARESGVHDAEFIVAVDVTRTDASGAEALIRIATGVEREWLEPTDVGVRHELDASSGAVRAWRVERYDAITLAERPAAPDPGTASELVAAELMRRGPDDEATQLLRRLRFAGAPASFEAMARRAAAGLARVSDVDLAAAIPLDVRRRVERDAPERLPLPSGRAARLDYREDGSVFAAVKLQELFGLAETPRLGPNRVPVTFELLSPAGRPVQVTSDLRSFWTRGYPEVRRELRARYPKHPWPDDPWSATPTHRTTRRR